MYGLFADVAGWKVAIHQFSDHLFLDPMNRKFHVLRKNKNEGRFGCSRCHVPRCHDGCLAGGSWLLKNPKVGVSIDKPSFVGMILLFFSR